MTIMNQDAQQILYGRCKRLKGDIVSPDRSENRWVDKIDPDQLFLTEFFENQFDGFSGGAERWLVASDRLSPSWLAAATVPADADQYTLTIQKEYLDTLVGEIDDQNLFAPFDYRFIDQDTVQAWPCDHQGKSLAGSSALEGAVNRHQLQAVEDLSGTVGSWVFYHHPCSGDDDCNYTELVYRDGRQVLGSVSVSSPSIVRWSR